MKKRVIVIGAGPAGLTAAHELLSRSDNMDVVVLEASDQMGGISRTVCHGGNRMDIGGHRFFTKEARVDDWWSARMPLQGMPSLDDKLLGRVSPLADGGPDPETTDRVMLMRNRVSRIYYGHTFYDYPVSLKVSTLQAMGIGTAANVGFSYLGSCLHKLPETNLENFYVNRFGRKLYSMFFEGYTEKLWGRHPRDISADWGSQRVKGLSVTAVLKDMLNKATGRKGVSNTETSLIERFRYPKFGPGQLWEQAAHEIGQRGGLIRTDCTVTGLASHDGTITGVQVTHSDGIVETMDGDVFMSTMPLKDLVAAMDDSVGTQASVIAKGLPYRDFVTVGLLVDRLAIRNETNIPTLGGVVPDNWIYVQDPGVRLGRIQVFNNWSPYLVADPRHTVWLGLEYFCDEGDAFWEMDDLSRVTMAANELVSMGVLDGDQRVLDSHVEHVRKAYPAYFDTYDRIDELIEWLDSHPNLFCLGRNGQHRYNNMDHSMMTAFLAVDDILAGTTDRSNVWNVNTDKAYAETDDGKGGTR